MPDIPSNAGAGHGIFEALHGQADGKAFADVDTVPEVQALANAAAAVMTGAAGGTAPTQAQLEALGITGVTPANLAAVLAAIAATPDDGTGVDTRTTDLVLFSLPQAGQACEVKVRVVGDDGRRSTCHHRLEGGCHDDTAGQTVGQLILITGMAQKADLIGTRRLQRCKPCDLQVGGTQQATTECLND